VDDIDSKEVTIVEGEIDKLSLEVAGITSAISVPAGAPPLTAKNPNLDYLNEPKLDGVKKIIVAVDTDAPGRKLSSELIRRLGAERCYTVEWPEGTKDANEVLLKFGAEKLKEFIQNAKPVPIVGLIEASNLKTNIHDIYENGHQPGESPGTDALSHYYTVKPGQMSIVTGIPSSGKSAWVDWVMYSLAKNSHWKFGVCSPENYPIEEHIIKLIELRSGKAFYGNNKLSKQKVDDNLSWVNEHFYFLAQEEEVKDWSIKGVLDMAKALVKRKGINGLVLDPWNEFDHTRTNGMSETEHISRSLSEIRQFARNYNCHVWVVAHPFKLRKLESGDYPVPTLYDIAGSAHFYNKADMGVSISRDPKNPTLPVTIAVQKVRFKRCGVVGEHLMTYDFANNRYDDYTQL
jgi:twinkle protein